MPAKTNGKGVSYAAYILSLLLFGTNGLYVAHISVASSHIVLFRTLIGGLALTALVLLRGGFSPDAVRSELGRSCRAASRSASTGSRCSARTGF